MPRLTGLGLTVKSPAAGPPAQTIEPAHIASGSVVYAPMVHRGTIRILEAKSGQVEDVTSFSIPLTVPASDNLGVILFLSGEESPSPSTVTVTVGGVTIPERGAFDSVLTTYAADLPSGEDELLVTLPTPAPFTWSVFVLDGVNGEHLDAVAIDEDASAEIALSATYATNSLYLGASFGWHSDDFTQDALSGVFKAADGGGAVGAFYQRIALIAMPISGAVTADFGVTNTPTPSDDERTAGLYVKGIEGTIAPSTIAAGSQVFAPVFTHAGQTFYPGHIASTAAVYTPSFKHVITAPHIASTATVYAPTFAAEPGATQYIQFCFIGGGTPSAFNGPHIASTAAVYAPEFTAITYIELEFIESGEQIFVPTFGICLNVGDGDVFAPTFANV